MPLFLTDALKVLFNELAREMYAAGFRPDDRRVSQRHYDNEWTPIQAARYEARFALTGEW